MAGARSERLLSLIQLLCAHRFPVAGDRLAEELGVSLRTLYRDIASLRAQGAAIEGEPGIGYVLKPGFLLPPMMFSQEEVEALVLGSRWVETVADPTLSAAATQALAKIATVLPAALSEQLDETALIIGPHRGVAERADIAAIRGAIRTQTKLEIRYSDENGVASDRIIWPVGLAYFERVRVVIAWCEKRDDFRHFRTDRIDDLSVLDKRYPRRKSVLLAEWRAKRRSQHS